MLEGFYLSDRCSVLRPSTWKIYRRTCLLGIAASASRSCTDLDAVTQSHQWEHIYKTFVSLGQTTIDSAPLDIALLHTRLPPAVATPPPKSVQVNQQPFEQDYRMGERGQFWPAFSKHAPRRGQPCGVHTEQPHLYPEVVALLSMDAANAHASPRPRCGEK